MRILVSGGSGFLGSAFVRAAVADGHDIAVLSRRSDPTALPRVEWLHGDLAAPPLDAIARFAPDTCVHTAWIATPGVYLESPENHDWVRWSEDFVAALAATGLRHVVALGTCIEYRQTGAVLSEDTSELAPVSVYARCKHDLHRRLRERLAGGPVALTWSRIFYPYGTGEHPARLASSVLADLRAGRPVRLRTATSTKDYIHVDDVADALLVLARARPGTAVNVGTGAGVKVGEIARRLAALVERPDLVPGSDPGPEDPADRVVADASRLRSLGWRPKVALDEGLRRLVEATRQ